jgi:acyl-CoA synthetase (AMP-forming)/AMP-acid ligase II
LTRHLSNEFRFSGPSVPAMLAERANRGPDEECFHTVTFVERAPVATAYSNAQLFSRVERYASMLEDRGVKRGDSVVLSVADSGSFVSCLLAAQCLGAIPVPAPSLSDSSSGMYLRRLRSIVEDAEPVITIVDDVAAGNVMREVLGDASICVSDEGLLDVRRTRPKAFDPNRAPDEVAFLQYTSGSTGNPRGVVVLHRNLVANIQGILQGAAMTRDDVIYSWLPLFHDMGLVAVLSLGLYAGLRTYVASPRTFMLRPDSWLRAITAFRATFSAAPNFAFDVLAHKVPDRAIADLDLRSWRLAFDGAEPVHAATMAAFTERFAAHGFRASSFRPAYGLAECTLAASFPRPETPNSVSIVHRAELQEHEFARPAGGGERQVVSHTSVGVAIPGHEIRVVTPTGVDRPERHVGEIVVRGPSVTPGYFRELAAGVPARSELRTGDLGYIADGELYVVGRLKDMLIVAGKKYAPSDIEHRIGIVDGIRRNHVVVFAIAHNGTDAAYAAVALEPGMGSRRMEIVKEIHRVVMADFGLSLADVAIMRPGDLPRTSSGKAMRSSCAMLYRANRLGAASGLQELVPVRARDPE